jgi:hypothetical protein
MRIDHVAVGRIMRAPQAIGPRLIRFAHFGGDDDGCGHGLALTVRARHRYHTVKWTDISGVILNLFQDDELCCAGKIWHKKTARSCDGAAFCFSCRESLRFFSLG